MASDAPSPRALHRAALLDLGWWLGGAAVGLLVALSVRDTPFTPLVSAGFAGPLLGSALLCAAIAAATVAVRRGFGDRDLVPLLHAAGWATLAGGAAAGLAGLAAEPAGADLPPLTGAIAGVWIAAALLIDTIRPVREPLIGRARPVALALVFVGVEVGLASVLFAAEPLAQLGAPVSMPVASGLLAIAGVHVATVGRVSRAAGPATIAAAGIAALGLARAGGLETGIAMALLAAAAAMTMRSAAARGARSEPSSAAERRIAELGATLPDGLFLVDPTLNVVAIGTGGRNANAPLELTFIDRSSPSGSPRLESVIREVDARGSGADETSRLTRELRATIGELLESRRTIELQRTEIERASHTDPLTGLPNRGAILARLEQEVAQARRYQHPVAVLVVDIDGFGGINREHGIERADAALRELAMRMRLRSREADALGRLSGDSFLAILPHTDERGVMTLGDALRRRVAGHPLVDDGRPLLATVSAGAAVMAAGDDESAEALIGRAEAALARAVRQGGDQVAFDGVRRLSRRAASG